MVEGGLAAQGVRGRAQPLGCRATTGRVREAASHAVQIGEQVQHTALLRCTAPNLNTAAHECMRARCHPCQECCASGVGTAWAHLAPLPPCSAGPAAAPGCFPGPSPARDPCCRMAGASQTAPGTAGPSGAPPTAWHGGQTAAGTAAAFCSSGLPRCMPVLQAPARLRTPSRAPPAPLLPTPPLLLPPPPLLLVPNQAALQRGPLEWYIPAQLPQAWYTHWTA